MEAHDRQIAALIALDEKHRARLDSLRQAVEQQQRPSRRSQPGCITIAALDTTVSCHFHQILRHGFPFRLDGT